MTETTEGEHDWTQELRSRVKHLTQPIVDSLDSKLREQVDHRVDERVDEQMSQMIDDALNARLAVIERAIADLDRTLQALEGRLQP